MRVSREFLTKALDEGFGVFLKVDDKVVGSLVRTKEDYVYLENKGFNAVQKLENYKNLKANKVEIIRNIVILRG